MLTCRLHGYALTPFAIPVNLTDLFSQSTGSFLGPLIGGSLSRPVERFPDIFGDNAFLTKYPYFLPCAVPATFTLLAWFMTLFFLKEVSRSITSLLASVC